MTGTGDREVFQAYLECDDDLQQVARDMLQIINDPETDEDDRHMSLATLADVLLPNFHKGQLGMDYAESETEAASENPDFRKVVQELDREDAGFAENLERVMREKGVSQTELAKAIGVGQPAISNMLSRNCRPQRRTIQRLAEALGVRPQDIWSG